jgi:hypothetical protein
MLFNLMFTDILVILQLSPGSIKGIPYCYVRVLMGMIIVRLPTDHDFLSGHGYINVHLEEVSLVMMFVVGFDDYATGSDLVAEVFEFTGFFFDD